MVVKKEDGEASGSHDIDHHQPACIATEEVTERVDIIIDHKDAGSPTVTSMKDKYESLKKAINETAESPKPLIQRVPYMLRSHKNFDKYYEPKVMAIGPLHHRLKPHLQPAEQHKLRLAGLFVQESGLDTEILYNKIWKEIRALRECFDQEEIKPFTEEELAWMLFVDGCTILHLIKCTIKGRLDELKIKDNQLVLIIRQDLFLLENQIPFRVLELLTSSDSNMKKQWRRGIEMFVANAMNIGTAELEEIEENQSPIHLLHLLCQMHQPKNPCEILKISLPEDIRHTFRNVKQDLKSAGIRLEPSETEFLTDISFTSGKLKLPPILVDDSTGPKFMNLIAYEMCPDYDNDFIVNSYVCFLHSLVDQPEDAMELRNSGILSNHYGSDEEVVHLFNDISTHLMPNRWAYSEVKSLMEIYCSSKWKIIFLTWIAQARQDYFSNPWTIIALVGGVIVLVFTAIQTWFTISPSK